MQYFRILDPDDLTTRWYLRGVSDAAGVELDPRVFRYGDRLTTDEHQVLGQRLEAVFGRDERMVAW